MATILTYAGEEYVVDKLTEAVQTKLEYIGWGIGAGTASKGDTDVFNPSPEARVQGSTSKQGAGSAAKLQVVATMTSASAQSITNAGLFTASSSGTLGIHGDHVPVGLQIGDQITYTFTLDPS